MTTGHISLFCRAGAGACVERSLLMKSMSIFALLGTATIVLSGCGGGGGGGSSSPAASPVPTTASLTLASSLQQNIFYPNTSPTLPTGTVQITPPPASTVNSILSTSRIAVAHFTSTFDVQFTAAASNGDGLTFVVENSPTSATGRGGSTARGAASGGLGYEGMGASVAFKIDTKQNAGDPSANSVGVYVNGASPKGGDDVSSKLNFHNGDVFHVVLAYDGTNLTATIADNGPTGTSPVSGATFTKSYPVNVVQQVGGPVAYAGFTAATDTANPQNLLSWNMTSP